MLDRGGKKCSASSHQQKLSLLLEKDKPATTPRSARADTIASELDSIKEESFSESFSISQSTQSVVRTAKRTQRSESEIPEDVPDTARTKASQSSIREELTTNGQMTASIAEEIPTSRSGKRSVCILILVGFFQFCSFRLLKMPRLPRFSAKECKRAIFCQTFKLTYIM